MDSFRVMHDGKRDTWCVSNESEATQIQCFGDRDEAVEFGRSLAQDSIFGRLTVQNHNGLDEIMWSYGADPVG